MKQNLLLCAVLMMTVFSRAQKSFDGLVQAEKNFAAFSVTHGTKEAFLHFLDTNGIVFDHGKPVNGLDFWSKKEKQPGILNWHPKYAALSDSKDFGFTSGPWTFQSPGSDTVNARGYYATIWHITQRGEWKFLVDLGVEYTPVDTDTGICRSVANNNLKVYRGSLQSLLKTEKKFIQKTKEPGAGRRSRSDWYKKYISGSYILNRNYSQPAVDTDLFLGAMNRMPKRIHYTISGWGIASSGDIGYVYGVTLIEGFTNNYLRVWRKEKAGWKIILEVLRY